MNTIEKAAQSALAHPAADTRSGYGWKILTPWGSTEGNDTPGIAHKRGQGWTANYELPRPGQKWSEWQVHPEPDAPDGEDCGHGRWHVMKRLDARYSPASWWPWFAEYRGVIGESEEKAGVSELRLRRVRPAVFWRIARLGYLRGANLSGADLRGANLSGANLRGANLRGANLREANLYDANLRSATLLSADLSDADLYGADLRGATLHSATLHSATLSGADLSGADLSGADLSRANLRNADLRGANLRNADLRDADLYCADLRDADLYCANLSGADLSGTAQVKADLKNPPLLEGGIPAPKTWIEVLADDTNDGRGYDVDYTPFSSLGWIFNSANVRRAVIFGTYATRGEAWLASEAFNTIEAKRQRRIQG